ncbi:hypothetical protein [Niallia sp. Krafla_26]|uniref:hypothetical protein n=1 Tax=Niallia sp. Krafla_26 TaxID=3064703 RepID=UPI003D16F647
MLELLLDLVNGQTDYSMMIGLLIGFSFQFIWVFKTEYKLVQHIHSPSAIQMAKNSPKRLNTWIYVDKRIMWIVKIIRRKENPGEESDLSISKPIF